MSKWPKYRRIWVINYTFKNALREGVPIFTRPSAAHGSPSPFSAAITNTPPISDDCMVSPPISDKHLRSLHFESPQLTPHIYITVLLCQCSHISLLSLSSIYLIFRRVVRGLSTYQKILSLISFAFKTTQHTGQTWSQGGLVRNKKNKSSADDFNDHKTGRGYPRGRGLLLNESSGW